MKLDYNTIKTVLLDVEQTTDGFEKFVCYVKKDDDDTIKNHGYHCKLLVENNFIDGTIVLDIIKAGLDKAPANLQALGITYVSPDIVSNQRGIGQAYKISCEGLTLSGHKLLESMKNDNIWNKIKDNAKSMGVEGLKQIPALALSLLTGK